jgi:hypothetical protein
VAVVLAPFVAYNLLHFGTASAPHVTGNLAELGGSWWAERLDFAGIWLGIHRAWTRVAAGLLILAAVGGRLLGRPRWAMVVGLIGIAGLGFEVAQGHELRENLWRVLPLGLLALLPSGASPPARRTLWLLVLVPVVGSLATAPNDGGGQWGPRYLLAAVPPLVILAFDSARRLPEVIGRPAAWAGIAFVLTCNAFVSLSAYRELGDTKRFYAGMAAETAREADTRDLLTDVWWLPQVSAAVLDAQRVLWVREPDQGRRWLIQRAPREVVLVQSAESVAATTEWTRGTCYQPVSDRRSETGLRYTVLACR